MSQFEVVYKAVINGQVQYFDSKEEAEMVVRGPKIREALEARKVFNSAEIDAITVKGKAVLDAFQVQSTKKGHRAKVAAVLTAVIANEQFCEENKIDRSFIVKAKEDIESTWKFTKARPPAEALAECGFGEELIQKIVKLRTEIQADLKAGVEKRALPPALLAYREEQRKLKAAANESDSDVDPEELIDEDDDEL